MFFDSLSHVSPLEGKVRLEIVNVNSNNPIFTLLVLRQINVVAIVIILVIHMQEFVFLIL